MSPAGRDTDTTGLPTRREPPPFRRLAVQAVDDLTDWMRRVVLGGPELDGFHLDAPAASIRLLLPPPGAQTIIMPEWTGNQFELPGGERAPIRTFTPRYLDLDRQQLTIDVVVHDHGAASDWVRAVRLGDVVAVSGPGRGYEVVTVEPISDRPARQRAREGGTGAASYLLMGDETAIPAIGQLLETIPENRKVTVHVEIGDPDARLDLPVHARADINWHELAEGTRPGDTLLAVAVGLESVPDAVWVAGEAAGVQRIRKHFFGERGLPRSTVTARGYWKQGRSAT